jgi:putative MFS transporter
VTFIGMMIGSFLTGFLGDRYGRRFTYQANLVIFGLASLASALVKSMDWLIVLRGIMGVGLGAEMVVGFSTLTQRPMRNWRCSRARSTRSRAQPARWGCLR